MWPESDFPLSHLCEVTQLESDRAGIQTEISRDRVFARARLLTATHATPLYPIATIHSTRCQARAPGHPFPCPGSQQR